MKLPKQLERILGCLVKEGVFSSKEEVITVALFEFLHKRGLLVLKYTETVDMWGEKPIEEEK